MPTTIHDYTRDEDAILSVPSSSEVLAQLPGLDVVASPYCIPVATAEAVIDPNWFDTPAFNVNHFAQSTTKLVGSVTKTFRQRTQAATGTDQITYDQSVDTDQQVLVTQQSALTLDLRTPTAVSTRLLRSVTLDVMLVVAKKLERINFLNNCVSVNPGTADWMWDTGYGVYGNLPAGTICLLSFVWIDGTLAGTPSKWRLYSAIGPFSVTVENNFDSLVLDDGATTYFPVSALYDANVSAVVPAQYPGGQTRKVNTQSGTDSMIVAQEYWGLTSGHR